MRPTPQFIVTVIAAAVLAAALVFSPAARAFHENTPKPEGVVGRMITQVGWINLYTTRGECEEGWQRAISTAEGTPTTLEGCWAMREDKIGILWADGDARVYYAKSFGMLPGI